MRVTELLAEATEEVDFPIIYDIIRQKLEADVEYHIYLPPAGELIREVTSLSYYKSDSLPDYVAVRLGWVNYPKGDRQASQVRRLFFKPEQLEKWKLTKVGAADFHLDLSGEEEHASS
jgi:hypothetical protein